MTGHSKKIIVFPPSVQDFFVIYHVSLNARVSGYLDLKFHNLSPFGGFFGVQKGTNCEILNLNNRRIGCLKIHVIFFLLEFEAEDLADNEYGIDYMTCAPGIECTCKNGRVKRRVKRGVMFYNQNMINFFLLLIFIYTCLHAEYIYFFFNSSYFRLKAVVIVDITLWVSVWKMRANCLAVTIEKNNNIQMPLWNRKFNIFGDIF